jgi:peptidylprolyl isomerase
VKFLALISALCLTLALAACGGSSSAGTTKTAAESSPPDASLVKLEAQIPQGPPPRKLVVDDLKVGSGPEAKTGERVTVQYIGVAYKTGKQFDIRDRSEPFNFLIAPGQVQPGWIKGVPGMKVDGQRELIIPPHLTLNELGRPETLVYVIELLEVE